MRTRSLLAWLGGFEARVATTIANEDDDHATSTLALLQDGQVLWNVMDQLHDGKLQRTRDNNNNEEEEEEEEEEGEEQDENRCWKALLPFLRPTLPRAIAAQLASSSSSSFSSSSSYSSLMPLSMLPAILEAFLGAAVGPEVPERSQSIHQILALSVRIIVNDEGGREGGRACHRRFMFTKPFSFSFLSLLHRRSTRSSSRA
jgi:hypothetical protein